MIPKEAYLKCYNKNRRILKLFKKLKKFIKMKNKFKHILL
jgi:hypothetical protein